MTLNLTWFGTKKRHLVHKNLFEIIFYVGLKEGLQLHIYGYIQVCQI